MSKPPKLAQKLAPTVIPRHGHGRLLSGGQPGHKGAGGRPQNAYKDWVRELLESDKVRAEVKRVMEDADHPAFNAVFGKLLVYVFGPPKPAVDANENLPLVIIDI